MKRTSSADTTIMMSNSRYNDLVNRAVFMDAIAAHIHAKTPEEALNKVKAAFPEQPEDDPKGWKW